MHKSDVEKYIVREAEIPVSVIYDLGWWDIEELYEQAGWDVKCDTTKNYQSLETTFVFQRIPGDE